MKKRHVIRVLVTHSKTNFFLVKGEPHGFEYELLQQYGKFLNKKVSRKKFRTNIVFIPVPFEQLLPGLIEGKGDIAAAGLTITPEREKIIAFSDSYLPRVEEIVVMRKKLKGLTALEALAGRSVYIIRGGSYGPHLAKLNSQFAKKNLSPITVIEASEYLATEDLLELVNAGVIDLAVADRHIAELWAPVLPKISVRTDLSIHAGGKIGWAIRKENTELRKSLNTFIRSHKKGTLMGNILFKRYYQNRKWISNPLESRERRKLEQFMALFQKYGKKYEFDWLAIAAQAYQESGLDHTRQSPQGAVGIMQILPSTAADDAVNIPNIQPVENNIHAGVKYLAHLRNTYFQSPRMAPNEQLNFAYAAYNMGPRKVRQLQQKAKAMGLDPNRWFFHVERAALKFVGQEPVRYVANIHKYYIAYTLVKESESQKFRELKELKN
ncbi:transglycosylase SLT domain-containing protein [Candidatus Nitronereus thalassa]|uniref:Transporter substrate-binding domain-containing protein n=1 Tax=Candidatus Nitronereus thalassa TaxID=3020898 RepID=A0ABU3K5Q8_9BACT|nr:transporter substrate-binding domain-containing protein [Candidatus Nitronereus thalassa]MDT7041759.1 transporter substrate-binding domain-containing protein [Candidatus Nitronereus thalassa]